MIPGEWVEQALCAQIGGDEWYPEIGESKVTAKRICRRCDVIQQCREWALKTKQQEGVWGGTSPRERRKLWGCSMMAAEWMSYANCAGTADVTFAKSDPFYPETPKGRPGRPRKGKDAGPDYTEAKGICKNCPVASQCYAFGAKDPEGVWGGTTPEQRKSSERLARYHRSNPQAGYRQQVPA